MCKIKEDDTSRVVMPPGSVFVAGARGLVGSALVQELVTNGFHVVGLVRRRDGVTSLEQLGAHPVLGDLAVPGDWENALTGVESVVDATQARLAGRLTVSRARQMAEARRQMTGTLLDAIRRKAPSLRRYVALSGLEDYESTGDAWFDESTPLAARPKGFAHIGLRVLPLLREAREKWGLPLVLLRMGLIYGNSGWFPGFVERIRTGKGVLVGSGRNYSSLVAAVDVAQAIRLSLERARPGSEYIVADDEPVVQEEWVGYLARLCGVAPPRRRIPVWLASLAVGRVNAETFSSSKRPRNRRMKEELGVTLRHPTVRDGFPRFVPPPA